MHGFGVWLFLRCRNETYCDLNIKLIWERLVYYCRYWARCLKIAGPIQTIVAVLVQITQRGVDGAHLGRDMYWTSALVTSIRTLKKGGEKSQAPHYARYCYDAIICYVACMTDRTMVHNLSLAGKLGLLKYDRWIV